MHLTENIIQNLEIKGCQYDVWDDVEKGFLVRVNTNGSKTYISQYARGKRIKIARFGDISLKMAKLRASEIWVAAKNGQLTKQKPLQETTYLEYLDKFYYDWLSSNIDSAKETYQMLLTHFATLFGKCKLSEIDSEKLNEWKEKRLKAGIKKSTIDRNIGAFKSSLNRAVEKGIIAVNPIAKVELYQEQIDRIRYLSDDERERLHKNLTCFPLHFRTMVIIALFTGLRRKSLLSLKWNNIFLSAKYPYLEIEPQDAKAKKMISVPISDTVKAALIEWKQKGGDSTSNGLVFINPKTGARYKSMRKPWGSLMKMSDITNFTWRDQRHDCASRLVQNDVDLYKVSKILGHATTKMTQRYAHIADKNLAEAVAKLD